MNRAVLAFAVLPSAIGCQFAGGTSGAAPDGYEGMVRIKAAGKSFTQGSSGELSQPIERPAVANSFTYDFHMDVTEVTRARYHGLMGGHAAPTAGSGDLPMANVTWFDAALFCNARGKAEGLDTVYAYEAAARGVDGSVHALTGLVTHLDRKGFRLPTEAEWEFAARAGAVGEFPWGGFADSAAAGAYAWHAGNSGNAAKPVAGLEPNAFGLHDMAGNVMEWVNDWKGAYPRGGASDFAGARDPGPESDAPVKGGAFRFGLRSLRPAARTAVYSSTRSSRADYVGFRCVMGAIANPRFAAPDGILATTDPVRIEVSRIQNLVEGRAAKLVFVNATPERRHLAYVDYRQHPPRVKEFQDHPRVFHPVISPDGGWVAYGTAVEGSSGESTLFLRALDGGESPAIEIGPGSIPRWWVSGVDTFLVYASSAMDNSQDRWAGSRTLLQKVAGGRAVGAPQELAQGAFHDGRSRDGRWLATGFRLLKVRDGRDGSVRTLFTSPGNGKRAGDTSQVCNVSIAPDSSGRTLFLDFGYEGRSGITGSFYDIHQVAFQADPSGRVLRWFRAPAEVRGWEHLEWSNHPGFAVSSSTDEAGRHRALYLLDLDDSTYTRLATGTDLAMPALWLGGAPDSIPTAGLDLDSLGHYDSPARDVYQSVFASRMATFWSRHASLELIVTGSSHVYSGIDPRRFTRHRTLSMGYPANGWLGQEAWVTGYALNHCPKLKVLIMEVFPGWLKHPDGDFTWLTQMSMTKGVEYDMRREFWKDGLPFGFEELVRAAPNPTGHTEDSTGFHFVASIDWGEPPKVPAESEWDTDQPDYEAAMRRAEAFLRMAAARGIHVLLVHYPTSPAYRGHAYLGPYGPRTSVARDIVKRFRGMESISPYVHFYDAHDFGNHDYGPGEALNDGHLSTAGAAKLTRRLDSLVNAFGP